MASTDAATIPIGKETTIFHPPSLWACGQREALSRAVGKRSLSTARHVHRPRLGCTGLIVRGS